MIRISSDRLNRIQLGCVEQFGKAPTDFFSASGRTEIGGNHTDHQCGHVLAAAIDLDIVAGVVTTGSGVIRFQSEGYPCIEVDLSELAPREAEQGTSAALIRGIAARMQELGADYATAGFDAYAVSDVMGGSGLSSSAAFEVLIGTIINDLYCKNRFSAVEIAKIGQYAENIYFGKPCGLMDQCASSVGGVVAIDFAVPDDPTVERIDLDLDQEGYALCIIDSHASHADLTEEFADVVREMNEVAAQFGKETLSDVPEAEFMAAIPHIRTATGDRAILRSMHFYEDDKRAVEEAEALKRGDFQAFLELVNESGLSSALQLQNVTPRGQVDDQSLMLTISLAQYLLKGEGAVRVHGGGFGGTAQAFVPRPMLDEFKAGMEAVLGAGSCHVLSIRPQGGTRVEVGADER